jgi:hypothetical protein
VSRGSSAKGEATLSQAIYAAKQQARSSACVGEGVMDGRAITPTDAVRPARFHHRSRHRSHHVSQHRSQHRSHHRSHHISHHRSQHRSHHRSHRRPHHISSQIPLTSPLLWLKPVQPVRAVPSVHPRGRGTRSERWNAVIDKDPCDRLHLRAFIG